MPERTDFWGIPHTWISPEILVYSIMGLSVLVLLVRFYMYAKVWWQVGRPTMKWDKLPERIGRLIRYAIIQVKVLWQRYPGVMHIGLAWGFFIFFLGTALATIDSHFYKFLRGNTYLLYKFVLDLFAIFFLIGAGMAIYRRFIQRPDRLTLRPGFTWSLALIVVIVLGGLTTESMRLAIEKPAWAWWMPTGWSLAQLWIASGASNAVITGWHNGVWVFHLLTVALLFVTLPGSTLGHVVTGPLNIFFSKTDRSVGELAPIAETSEGEPIFVHTLRDLTWKQLLEGDACTECGRCQDACPAFASGTSLSPKELILSIHDSLHRDGPALISGNGDVSELVGESIRDAMLWSCTTCGACVRECPVLIEHIDTIVDMRRYLVMEGRVDDTLQNALSNLGRYGNSFGQSERMRARWSQALEFKIKDARKTPVEYLWFVGDYASYNPSMVNITSKTAQVFKQAGLDFGILYDAERNTGNDVRRVGEEGLFEMLMEKNTAALAKCEFQAILTTDPHSYNTLKNEYPQVTDGGQPVFHSVEILEHLVSSGQLKFNQKLDYKVTYQDPCYLGRYNGIYDPPRRLIAATGCKLVEMPRSGDRALCCGAGGGRIWMEEGEIGERPSEARVREAINLNGVQILAVTCPKDISMFQDAVKTTGNEDRLVVRDLIELVYEAL